MKKSLSVLLLVLFATPGTTQSFSCSFGRAACLDYGDTVCPSYGKCVDESAECFAEYTCGFEGFACKSDVSECVDKYNALAEDYSRLESLYDRRQEDLSAAQADALMLRVKVSEQLEVLDCVENADDIDTIKDCLDD